MWWNYEDHVLSIFHVDSKLCRFHHVNDDAVDLFLDLDPHHVRVRRHRRVDRVARIDLRQKEHFVDIMIEVGLGNDKNKTSSVWFVRPVNLQFGHKRRFSYVRTSVWTNNERLSLSCRIFLSELQKTVGPRSSRYPPQKLFLRGTCSDVEMACVPVHVVELHIRAGAGDAEQLNLSRLGSQGGLQYRLPLTAAPTSSVRSPQAGVWDEPTNNMRNNGQDAEIYAGSTKRSFVPLSYFA